jgi:ribosomal protein L30E
LQFHHIDPSQKDFNIGGRGSTRAWETIKAEIEKCILLCANCHAEEHYKEMEYEKLLKNIYKYSYLV